MTSGGGQFDSNGPDAGSALDAYADGLMSPADRAAFEKRLAADPALAAGFAAQKRVDRALAGLFMVPPFIGLPSNGHPTPHPATPSGNGAATAAAATAAAAAVAKTALPYNLLLGGIGAVVLVALSWLAYITFSDPRRSVEQVYNDPVSARSMPQNCSSEPETPETACNGVLAGLVTLKKLPADVQIIGMGIEPILSQRTLVTRAKVQGREVLVLIQGIASMDAAAKERLSKKSAGLHVFERQDNSLLLVELTPLDKPRLLDLYEFPARPGRPQGENTKP